MNVTTIGIDLAKSAIQGLSRLTTLTVAAVDLRQLAKFTESYIILIRKK